MQSLVNFLGRRRFNYIDTIGIFAFAELWGANHLVLALLAFFLIFLVSVTVEGRVR